MTRFRSFNSNQEARAVARATARDQAKGRRIAVRITDDDHSFLEQSASQAGLSIGAFLRTVALGTAGARAVKKPRIEREQLAKLLGEIGKLGSNVNQIARWANTDKRAPMIACWR